MRLADDEHPFRTQTSYNMPDTCDRPRDWESLKKAISEPEIPPSPRLNTSPVSSRQPCCHLVVRAAAYHLPKIKPHDVTMRRRGASLHPRCLRISHLVGSPTLFVMLLCRLLLRTPALPTLPLLLLERLDKALRINKLLEPGGTSLGEAGRRLIG